MMTVFVLVNMCDYRYQSKCWLQDSVYQGLQLHKPVLHDEGKEVGHAGGPELAEGVVVEALVQGDHVVQVLAGDG